MIRVSVLSTRQLIRSSTKIIACSAIFIILVNILKYSNAHFSQTEIDANKCISYITEEITAMDNKEIMDISKINPEHILDSELKFSQYMIAEGDADELENYDPGNVEDNKNNTLDAGLGVSNEGENTANTNQEVNNQTDIQSSEIVVQDVPKGIATEVISSSYKPTYNYQVNGVKIKNESKYDFNTMNFSPSNINISNKNVIIFHTHTCESYTQTSNNKYVSSGNYRTTDLNHSVARVGDVLQAYLSNYGFNVTHDKSYHDYPAYNGSYGRSLKTVENIISKSNKTDIVIDLHRDAMSDENYAPKVKIGDEYVSQIMFVIGTDGSGLKHDNWKKNLEFAIKVQQKADEMYPGLFKPIIVRNARYNQHLAGAATIIEFGATGNTLEECEGAAKYLAKVLAEL